MGFIRQPQPISGYIWESSISKREDRNFWSSVLSCLRRDSMPETTSGAPKELAIVSDMAESRRTDEHSQKRGTWAQDSGLQSLDLLQGIPPAS